MRKRRRGSTNDVIIDLTSLLDVIFIILLVVLCSQSRITNGLQELQNEAEAAKTQAESDSRLYLDQMNVADSLNQMIYVVSVDVPYNEENVTQRTIRILKEGETVESFALNGNNINGVKEEFIDCIKGYIHENEENPIILSLNEKDDYILYRDEVMVIEIFEELSQEYGNVYIKKTVGEEAK